ncbi:transient receptor potential-gamma protein [Eurytemora carolleeae]|uniref:transient receptor potential-gamma protein n=1 Tax=Eurytemora carolleeae TaxID=1294199 RepID=UPI000C790E2F|nr:transient receptor potential-gamma protein [Eurytemora carolleeae]|eukprot:XP_023336908.1 transient receptor potential-gamma protein-like [Eurytemora affinis]
MLENCKDTGQINIDCVDPLGRSALLMAIDNENLEMVELLLENKSWEAIPSDTATFTPDITPLILAAHTDNYEVIKILLDRGAVLPMPHDIRCGCEECSTSRSEDSLRHSRSRINSYKALASPSLIALSSKDPILTAFELSWELRRLAFAEHEFKSEYLGLRKQCQNFATALLDHTRSSQELEILLNHDPSGPEYKHGERMHLNRLKLAIKYRQKKFVAHPNVQQLLASIWYEGLPGFRQMNMVLQALEVCRIGLLFPFFSITYIICPWIRMSQMMRKPFIKFICNSASYFTFLFLLILASQRIEDMIGWEFNSNATKRGASPSLVESFILAWVAGLIWSEIKQLWDVGMREYISDMWNVVDFITNSLYVATIALRLVAYYDVQTELALGVDTLELPREQWDAWDPTLISEVSLSRMVMDIMKFCALYILVLFAFSCGMNQLLWYYAELEKQKCVEDSGNNNITTIENLTGGRKNNRMAYEKNDKIVVEINHCLAYRRFENIWETSQTLYWASFGLVDLDNFELTGIKEFTRFWGLLMFGTFSIINIIVLLNLLIAMMNHSYQLISEKADTEWKFARSKLWISYFEEGGTVPPLFRGTYLKLCGSSTKMKKEHLQTRKVKQASERDIKYQTIMRNLVRRYVTQEQRKAENEGVTEDDVNEIKNDISAFRFELIEIMRASGMKTQGASGPSGPGGKKNRQKERRLMKGFHLSTGASTTAGPSPASTPANPCNDKRSSLNTEISIDMTKRPASKGGFSRIARLVGSGNGGQSQASEERHHAEAPMATTAAAADSDSGKKWGKLSLTDAIKTAKVPRLMRGQRGNSSEESRGSLEEGGDNTLPRTRSRKDKYLKPRTAAGAGDLGAPGAGDPGTPGAGDPSAPGEPGGDNKDHLQVLTHTPPGGVETINETVSNKSFGNEPNMRSSGRLQRTNRIDDDDSGSKSSQSRTARSSTKSVNGQNEVLKSSEKSWDRLDLMKEDGSLQPLLGSDQGFSSGLGPSSPYRGPERRPNTGLGLTTPLLGPERRPTPGLGSISQPASFHSNVPGLQPMSTSRLYLGAIQVLSRFYSITLSNVHIVFN